MPSISCNAQECVHNKNNCCCLSNVKIGGENAKYAEKTNCENFCECNGSAENRAQSACMCQSIDCDATNCIYNNDKICNADRIDVIGAEAHKAHQTECYTFRMQ